MKYFGGLKTLIAAFHAARAVGRASRLQEQGRLADACRAASVGLEALRHPAVARLTPHAGSALAALTLIAEESCAAHESCASLADLTDSVQYLRSVGAGLETQLGISVPFLERRLLVRTAGNA